MQPGACCATNIGLDFDGGLQIGDSIADVKVIRRPARAIKRAAVSRITEALQMAMHPNSVPSPGSYPGGMFPASRQEAIAFPVVSPYRPLTATRAPIAGLTAFPKAGFYFNGESDANFNVNGNEDDEVPGYESLDGIGIEPVGGGSSWIAPQSYNVNMPSGYSLPTASSSSVGGSSKLQTIIGGIAAILPSTISAFKSQPYYNPNQVAGQQTLLQQQQQQQLQLPGAAYEGGVYRGGGVTGGGISDIGAQAGGAIGNLGDTVGQIVAEHPYLVLAAGAAALLMFMKPPGRR